MTYTRENIRKMPDNKLLAIILSPTGTSYYSMERSTRILMVCQNSLKTLYEASLERMREELGMGIPESIRLKAAFELANRRMVAEVLEKPKICNSRDVYQLFQHLSDNPYEEFWIVVLNKANRVIDRQKISEGGVSGTVVDLKRIFHGVLDVLGTGLILVHNHPSGNVQPSDNDKRITEKIVEAGKLLDIVVLDHIIVSGPGYFSYADSGLVG
jgi:DNA repair protein RadC